MSCAPTLHLDVYGHKIGNGCGRVQVIAKRGTRKMQVTYMDLAYMAATTCTLLGLTNERFLSLVRNFSYTEGRLMPLSPSLSNILADHGIKKGDDAYDFLRVARAMVRTNEEVYEDGEGGELTLLFLKEWLNAPEGTKSMVVKDGRFKLSDEATERRCETWMILPHMARGHWTR